MPLYSALESSAQPASRGIAAAKNLQEEARREVRKAAPRATAPGQDARSCAANDG